MKTKRTSQYANEHGPDSARFEHGGGSRSNTKGEYTCGPGLPKTLPTDVASLCVQCFREVGSCVSVPHAYFSCILMIHRRGFSTLVLSITTAITTYVHMQFNAWREKGLATLDYIHT